MISELVEYRELLWQLTLRDIRIRYKQALMGFGWALLMPLTIVAAGVVVRYAMAQMAGTELEASSFAGMAVKALPWAFFVGAIGFATNSLTTNRSLVTKVYFPRAVFPLSAVLAQAFDTSVGAVAIVAFLFLFLNIGLSAQILWSIPLLILLFLFTVGLAFFLSCANLFFRDVKYIVQVLLTFGIFFTPVFFEPAMFGVMGAKLMMLNPLAPILEGIRLAVAESHNLFLPIVVAGDTGGEILTWSPVYLAYSAGWAVFGLIGASVLFHRLEFLFAEYV